MKALTSPNRIRTAHADFPDRYCQLLQTSLLVGAALLAAGVAGCGGRPVPTGQPTNSQVSNKDPGKNKTVPKVDPNAPPQEMILGKFESAEQERGVEFLADGTMKMALPRQIPWTGKYTLVEGKTIEWKFPNDGETHKYKVAITPEKLTFTGTAKDATPVVYQRVGQFSKELDHPNQKPNDQQKKWIVGSWKGKDKNTEHLYNFYPDGTFSHLEGKDFFGATKTSVKMGTYRVHPDADNFLELTYPDTGATKAVYAEIGEKELGLPAFWDFCKHQRVEYKDERAMPIRPNVLTAFALFQECKADAEKAKQKYAGKTLEVAGVVTGYFGLNKNMDIFLCTGNAGRVKCSLDADDKKTAELLEELEFGFPGGSKTRVLTIKGQFAGMVKEVDAGAKAIGGLVGGEPVDKGPQMFVHLNKCQLLDSSELTLNQKSKKTD